MKTHNVETCDCEICKKARTESMPPEGDAQDEFVQKHLAKIMELTLDSMIVTEIESMYGGLQMASVQHFMETGKVSGSLYLAIKKLAKQFAVNWHKQAAQPISGDMVGVKKVNLDEMVEYLKRIDAGERPDSTYIKSIIKKFLED